MSRTYLHIVPNRPKGYCFSVRHSNPAPQPGIIESGSFMGLEVQTSAGSGNPALARHIALAPTAYIYRKMQPTSDS